MALPLFDNVLVDAVPPEPVRPPRNSEREAFERDRFATAGPFEEFTLTSGHNVGIYRIPEVRHGDPRYWAFWNAFKRGADGQSPPGVEHDEEIARYAADGYHLGRLMQPLPCMKENR
jgi:hypothetical protein